MAVTFLHLQRRLSVGLRCGSGSPLTILSERLSTVNISKFDSRPTQNSLSLSLSLTHLKSDLMHALHNEVGCLNHRVVIMVADKLKR